VTPLSQISDMTYQWYMQHVTELRSSTANNKYQATVITRDQDNAFTDLFVLVPE